jgi:hypothetical protein
MKGKTLVLPLVAVLSLGASGLSAAADTAPSFREKFGSVLDNLDMIFQRTQSSRGRALVADARAKMAAVSDDQLAEALTRGAVPDIAPLLAATRRLSGVVDRSDTRPRFYGREVTPYTPGLPGTPGILGACGGVLHDPAFTFGALVALQVARAIIAGAEFACEQIAVVAGFGANTSAICIPIAIAADAAAIPFELASFCAGEEDSALLQGAYDRAGHLHDDLEAARVGIIDNTNAARTEIVNNDNSNTTTILNNANASTTQIINNSNSNTESILASLGANADLAEARQIEDNLEEEVCPAWMSTPEYADVAGTLRLGGRFEKVVGVVQRVIDNARALQSTSRFDLACAQHSLDEAVEKAGRRPPYRAGRVCDLLFDAYEKATTSKKRHDHGHSDHDGHRRVGERHTARPDGLASR